MRQTTCTVSSLVILTFSLPLCAAALRPPAPQLTWKVGDSWRLRTWKMKTNLAARDPVPRKGSPIDITFEVRRLLSTSDFEVPYLQLALDRAAYGNPTLPPEGYKCFEVQVTFPPEGSGYERRFLLYFRRETGNLIRILSIFGKKEDPEGKDYRDLSPVPDGPIMGTDYTVHGTLFDFPDFTQDPNFVRARALGRDPNDKEVTKQTITTRTVKLEDGTEHEEYEVVMLAKHGTYEVKTIQKWRKGDPWWYEARHYENEKPIGYEAVLLRQSKPPQ